MLLSEDGSNGIDSEQNTLCPVIHNGSSTFNLAPENADQEHKHDIELQLHLKQQQQQQEKEAEEEKRRRQQQQERELSLNNQVRKGYSLDYFDQFNNVHNGINNYQASVLIIDIYNLILCSLVNNNLVKQASILKLSSKQLICLIR